MSSWPFAWCCWGAGAGAGAGAAKNALRLQYFSSGLQASPRPLQRDEAGSGLQSAVCSLQLVQLVQHVSGWWWVAVGLYPALVLEGIQRALMADLSATGFFARLGLDYRD